MNRKDFLRNLFCTGAAFAVPKIFQPPAKEIVEEVGSRGLLWHIQNAPVHQIDYKYESFTIGNFNELVNALREQDRNRPYYYPPYNF